MKQERWALITGASSGIGKALAYRFAREGWRLALVARDAARLDALSRALTQELHTQALAIPADLASPDAPDGVFKRLNDRGIRISVLVNNAGSGACGLFHELPADKDRQMLSLNIAAVTSLTRLAVLHMRANGGGRILNVASTGAYQPGPYTAVYYATKAYVLSLSQALRKELKASGILVSALCPGATATEFSRRAGKADIKGAMTPEKVADCAYKGLMRGKAVIIPGLRNKILIAASKLLPGSASAAVVARIQRRLTKAF